MFLASKIGIIYLTILSILFDTSLKTSQLLKTTKKILILGKIWIITSKFRELGSPVSESYWLGYKKGLVTMNTNVKCKSSTFVLFKCYHEGLFSSKYRSTITVRVTRSKVWYQLKGLIIRNTHVKYKGPTSNSSKVMTKVKVFII